MMFREVREKGRVPFGERRAKARLQDDGTAVAEAVIRDVALRRVRDLLASGRILVRPVRDDRAGIFERIADGLASTGAAMMPASNAASGTMACRRFMTMILSLQAAGGARSYVSFRVAHSRCEVSAWRTTTGRRLETRSVCRASQLSIFSAAIASKTETIMTLAPNAQKTRKGG
jgi:hypothetical protein